MFAEERMAEPGPSKDQESRGGQKEAGRDA